MGPRNCYRCGQDFLPQEDSSARVCPQCLQPKYSKEVLAGKELTPREVQIIRRVAMAESNKEIAFQLHLHENSVKIYVCRILKKKGFKNRTQLAIACILGELSP